MPAGTARSVHNFCFALSWWLTGCMKIIGQGGPSNDIFASLWSNIAAKYANNDKIIFGVYVSPFPSVGNLLTSFQYERAARCPRHRHVG